MAEEQYIAILIDSLEKKIQVLNEIKDVNKRQKSILKSTMSTPDDLDESLKDKDELIDSLTALDNGFESLFSNVKDEIENHKSAHKDEIKKMQNLIREITDLSVEVQREEQENKALADKKFATIRGEVKKVRTSQKAVTNYYKAAGKIDYNTPQFYDSKK